MSVIYHTNLYIISEDFQVLASTLNWYDSQLSQSVPVSDPQMASRMASVSDSCSPTVPQSASKPFTACRRRGRGRRFAGHARWVAGHSGSACHTSCREQKTASCTSQTSSGKREIHQLFQKFINILNFLQYYKVALRNILKPVMHCDNNENVDINQ